MARDSAASPPAADASGAVISFVTPYWSGREMMRIHLQSIRRFHPSAPILISKRGGDADEMEAYRREFDVRYWLEECEFPDAYVRLLQRCATDYVCILDHDTVLLAGLDPYLAGLVDGKYELVGVEERIRMPDSIWRTQWPESGGWLRFAPGCTAANFMMFNLRNFKARWGLRGIWGTRPAGTLHYEFDYGIGQKLTRQHLLRPFHARRYGMGNLLADEGAPVLWHQWYGSYRTRLAEPAAPADAAQPADSLVYSVVQAGEHAFLADYPEPDFSELTPAWGPEIDIASEQRAIESNRPAASRRAVAELRQRLLRWKSYGVRGFATRALARLDLWWRLR